MIPGTLIGLQDMLLLIFLDQQWISSRLLCARFIVVVKIMQCSVEASAFLYETMLLLSSTFAVT